MDGDSAFDAALAAFNPAGWPVHRLASPDAAPPAGPAIVVIRAANDPAYDRAKRRLHEIGVVGGARLAWIGATTPPPVPAGDAGPLVISFYTRATRYEAHADRLRASLDARGVRYQLVGLDVAGSWEMVCAFKAEFVRDQWKATDRPVIWLDADSTLEAPLGLLAAPGCDFAIHKHVGWKFASGTLLFGRGPSAAALLDRWVLRCQADPLMWDQVHLDAAWADVSAAMPLVTRWLPAAYCAIHDHYDAAASGPAVVLQHQASRAEAKAGRKKEAPPQPPEALRIARRASRYPAAPGNEAAAWVPLPPALGPRLRALAEGRLPLVDIGCGSGGLAHAFTPDEYIGADFGPEALLAARTALPGHRWRLLMPDYPFPVGGTVLLRGVPQASLPGLLALAAAAASRLILLEPAGQDAPVAACAAAGWLPAGYEAVDGGWQMLVFNRP